MVWAGFEGAGATRPPADRQAQAEKLTQSLARLIKKYDLQISPESIALIARYHCQGIGGIPKLNTVNRSRQAQRRSALVHARKVSEYQKRSILRHQRYVKRLKSLRLALFEPVIHTELALSPDADSWMPRIFAGLRVGRVQQVDLIRLIATLEELLVTKGGRPGRPRGRSSRLARLAMIIWRESGKKIGFTWDDSSGRLKGSTAAFVFRFVRLMGSRVNHKNLKTLLVHAKDDPTLH